MAIMKGGNFNTTDEQFVPILFDKYFDLPTQSEFGNGNEDENSCKFQNHVYFNFILKPSALKLMYLIYPLF